MTLTDKIKNLIGGIQYQVNYLDAEKNLIKDLSAIKSSCDIAIKSSCDIAIRAHNERKKILKKEKLYTHHCKQCSFLGSILYTHPRIEIEEMADVYLCSENNKLHIRFGGRVDEIHSYQLTDSND